jgi:hypothetical protein
LTEQSGAGSHSLFKPIYSGNILQQQPDPQSSRLHADEDVGAPITNHFARHHPRKPHPAAIFRACVCRLPSIGDLLALSLKVGYFIGLAARYAKRI